LKPAAFVLVCAFGVAEYASVPLQPIRSEDPTNRSPVPFGVLLVSSSDLPISATPHNFNRWHWVFKFLRAGQLPFRFIIALVAASVTNGAKDFLHELSNFTAVLQRKKFWLEE
jgi:hypothetical protein